MNKLEICRLIKNANYFRVYDWDNSEDCEQDDYEYESCTTIIADTAIIQALCEDVYDSDTPIVEELVSVHDVMPLYSEKPLFSPNKQIYGLELNYNDGHWIMRIINSDSIAVNALNGALTSETDVTTNVIRVNPLIMHE